MAEVYNNEGQFFETKDEIIALTDENIPTQNQFLVTAKKIRSVLKSIVESLWPRSYTAKVEDFQYYQFHNESGDHEVANRYSLNIPKCSTLYIPNEVIQEVDASYNDGHSDYYLFSIYMDNVENGHVLNLHAQCKIPCFPYTTGGQESLKLGYYKQETSGFWNPVPMGDDYAAFRHKPNVEESDHMLYFTNIVFLRDAQNNVYTSIGDSDCGYLNLMRGLGVLHLMYWDGLWYPVNLYKW